MAVFLHLERETGVELTLSRDVRNNVYTPDP